MFGRGLRRARDEMTGAGWWTKRHEVALTLVDDSGASRQQASSCLAERVKDALGSCGRGWPRGEQGSQPNVSLATNWARTDGRHAHGRKTRKGGLTDLCGANREREHELRPRPVKRARVDRSLSPRSLVWLERSRPPAPVETRPCRRTRARPIGGAPGGSTTLTDEHGVGATV